MHAEQYSPDSTLTLSQHHVLNLLAQGASITEAAAAADVHRNTVANWRRSVPAFAREFQSAGRERVHYWQDQGAGLAAKAVEVLSSILNDEAAQPSLRLRAALHVISMATAAKPEPIKACTAAAVYGQLFQQQAAPEIPVASAPKTMHNSAQFRASQPLRQAIEPGRNSPCPCGSGLKYKRCCANQSPGSANAIPGLVTAKPGPVTLASALAL